MALQLRSAHCSEIGPHVGSVEGSLKLLPVWPGGGGGPCLVHVFSGEAGVDSMGVHIHLSSFPPSTICLCDPDTWV